MSGPRPGSRGVFGGTRRGTRCQVTISTGLGQSVETKQVVLARRQVYASGAADWGRYCCGGGGGGCLKTRIWVGRGVGVDAFEFCRNRAGGGGISGEMLVLGWRFGGLGRVPIDENSGNGMY